jgi:hypothetical protein
VRIRGVVKYIPDFAYPDGVDTDVAAVAFLARANDDEGVGGELVFPRAGYAYARPHLRTNAGTTTTTDVQLPLDPRLGIEFEVEVVDVGGGTLMTSLRAWAAGGPPPPSTTTWASFGGTGLTAGPVAVQVYSNAHPDAILVDDIVVTRLPAPD